MWKNQGFVCLVVVLIGISSAAVLSGCGKAGLEDGNPFFTKVEFQAHNSEFSPLLSGYDFQNRIASLTDMLNAAAAPILDAGMMIYAIGQSGVDYSESLFLANESASGSLTLPNGSYKFMAMGYSGGTVTSGVGTLTSTARCAVANSGVPVTIGGGSASVRLDFSTTNYTVDDSLFPTGLRSGTTPFSLKFHTCDTAQTFPMTCTGTCLTCSPNNGDVSAFRVRLLGFKKTGGVFTEKTEGLKGCIAAATLPGNESNAVMVPFGNATIALPVEIGAYRVLDTNCSGTPSRLYRLENGLYSIYNTEKSIGSGGVILQSNGSGAANAHFYVRDTTIYTIFETNSTFTGNLGGISGADALCMADANYPGYGTYKALLMDSVPNRRGQVAAQVDWVLKTSTAYYRSNRTTKIGTTSANNVFATFNLDNAVGTAGNKVWVGIVNPGGWVTSANHCVDWTDGTIGQNGNYVVDNVVTAASFTGTSQGCNTLSRLYCVQQ